MDLNIPIAKPLIASAFEGQKLLCEIVEVNLRTKKDFEFVELFVLGNFKDSYGESNEGILTAFKSELRDCAKKFGNNSDLWRGQKIEVESVKINDKFIWKIKPL